MSRGARTDISSCDRRAVDVGEHNCRARITPAAEQWERSTVAVCAHHAAGTTRRTVRHRAPELAPLREHLASYLNPYSLIGYLNGAGGQLIDRLVTGDLACTHAQDQLRQAGSINHLRGLLVRAQHRTQALLDAVAEPADRLAALTCDTPGPRRPPGAAA